MSGFLSQNQSIVFGMLGMACLPASLLVGYIVFAYIRAAQRAKQLIQQPVASADAPSGLSLLQDLRTQPGYDADDLPDLAVLAAAPIRRTSLASDPHQIRLHSGIQTRATPLLTVMRDERDGRLLVTLDGVGYRSLADTPDAKREFTRIMKELSGIILSPESPSDTVSAELPTTADLLTSAQPSHGAADVSAFKAPAMPKVVGPLPGDLPSYKFDDNPAVIRGRGAGFKKVEFVAPPALDIPSAIEAYLQWRLATSGAFTGRELHVLSAPGGGVRIRVDNNYYDFVDDISDQQARIFIKEAIAEWQERQG